MHFCVFCWVQRNNRVVAVKRFNQQEGPNGSVRHVHLKEAHVMKQVEHPNLVRFLGMDDFVSTGICIPLQHCRVPKNVQAVISPSTAYRQCIHGDTTVHYAVRSATYSHGMSIHCLCAMLSAVYSHGMSIHR